MPLVKIQTNVESRSAKTNEVLAKVSSCVANALGKPESYVMVLIQTNNAMLFAGAKDPLAFVELKSIGLANEQTGALSKMLCELLEAELEIPQNRIYIEFASAPGKLWGWDGGTF